MRFAVRRAPAAALVAISLFAFAGRSSAAVPLRIAFQGQAKTSAGASLPGPISLQLRYYDGPTAGALLLTEDQSNVAVAGGLFSTQLGQGTLTSGVESTLTDVFRLHPNVWLETWVNGQKLSPRANFVSVPFALYALRADSVTSPAGSGFVTTDSTAQTKPGPLAVSSSAASATVLAAASEGAGGVALSAAGNGSEAAPNVALQISGGAIEVPSSAAVKPIFTHTSAAANISGAYSAISSPLTDNDPNAIIIVTHLYRFTRLPGGVGVQYNASSGKWLIYREDGLGMPANESFNVMVVKQ